MIYFDHNATTPLLSEARQAWLDAADKFIGNPSTPHRLGSRADAALQAAREKLAHWLGKLPAAGLGDCDFVSGCAHKFGGPKGVGFLKCPARSRLSPLLVGGKQEEGRRAGTENVASVLSMLAALEACEHLRVDNE